MQNELYDTDSLRSISNYLVRSNQTIAVAESVTAGHLQAALSASENASVFFQGGLTAYNLTQKYKHLHIDISSAMTCNCVSPIIAEEMSMNICKLFTTSWGIGITGYATPLIEEGIFDLFAYYSLIYKERVVKQDIIHAPHANVTTVQLYYTNHILRMLASEIENAINKH